jgi:hypothetical protein
VSSSTHHSSLNASFAGCQNHLNDKLLKHHRTLFKAPSTTRLKMSSSRTIRIRILVMSDTHDQAISPSELPRTPVDVVLHCGDFTNGSKIAEFESAISLLQQVEAPLKLAIAGNHDFSLDESVLQAKVREAGLQAEFELVEREYGCPSMLKRKFENAGVFLLDEGTHLFRLQNGARLTVYASPYTPSYGDWGFQYHPANGHNFDIRTGTDIVMTHGPPHGVMDRTQRGKRAGCPELFTAVAHARPRIHCFGHIHEGWGAKLVRWKHTGMEARPTHFTAIDNERSFPIRKLADMQASAYDTEEMRAEKGRLQLQLEVMKAATTSHCIDDTHPLEEGKHTLFVNASLEAVTNESTDPCPERHTPNAPQQSPWLIDIELQRDC